MSIERHTSPDGKFTLVADPADDMIALDGYSWCISFEQLAAFRIEPPIAGVLQLIDALATRRLVLVISRFDDTGEAIRDVWITHDAEAEKACCDEGESLEFRYWDGASRGVA